MLRDLGQALRLFRRERGFALAVVLSLALGIGANTAIFSVVNGVLLNPLPYRQPERLYAVEEVVPKFAARFPTVPVNLSHFMEWRSRATTFEQVALMQPALLNLTGAGEPELLRGALVSSGLVEMLGVQPLLGRAFTREEERSGPYLAILSHALWQRRFNGDRAVAGKTVTLDGRPYVVVGVLPPSFRFPWTGRVDVLVPLGYKDDQLEEKFGDFNWTAIARLRAGVPPGQALGELNVLQAAIMRGVPEVNMELRASLTPLADKVVGDSRRGILVLMAAVGAALLVLCVNLANLWFARAAARTREFAIRAALGASRARLVRESLAESFSLALAGGALGVAFAYGGLGALLRAAPLDLPRLADVRMDGAALGFALVVSLACGLLFGALPAFRSALHNPQDALKSGSRTATEGVRGMRIRRVLVAVEVGLSAALLITAGLLANSFVRLMKVDRGFDVERVLSVKVSLPSARYAENRPRTVFFDRLLAKAAALPGVTKASVVSALPLEGETWVDVVGTEHDPRPLFERTEVNVRFIGPDYFKVLGVPMRGGRPFQEGDRARPVAIIPRNTAARLWPGQDPVGRILLHNDQPAEVVGVVPDFRSTNLDKDPVTMLYIPYWQRPRTSAYLLLRTAMDPRAVAGAVRSAVWEVDGEVPVPEMKTLVEVLDASVAQRRFHMTLLIAFAAAALALASLGIYGVLAYSMARRRAEIGIRMALGAGAADVRRMAVVEGMAPAVCGLAAGIALALAAGQALGSLLFQVSARDPLTIGAVSAVLLAVAAAACLVPAARAARVDPSSALHAE